MIQNLKTQGLSISQIAQRTGLDRKTVRKYIDRGLEAPVYGPRQPRERLLEPFEAYLRERISAFPDLSGQRLLREIKGHGYKPGRRPVTAAKPWPENKVTPRPGDTIAGALPPVAGEGLSGPRG